MKIGLRLIKTHTIQTNVSCLVSKEPSFYGAINATVAFKTESGEWKMGNGEVCWFEPIYFTYLNEHWD